VGVGTFYRHFPQRSDLIVAVFKREVDATAADAVVLEREYGPAEAVERWLYRYTDYIATKHGFIDALHSGDPAFDELPRYFESHLGPALDTLYARAVESGEMRADVDPRELLSAVANLVHGGDQAERSKRMVALLVDGLRLR
jgi:AcrR family transcriptional regulator